MQTVQEKEKDNELLKQKVGREQTDKKIFNDGKKVEQDK